MAETDKGYPGFPQCRHGGDAAATELPTVAPATRLDLDLVTLRSVSEMDATANRVENKGIKDALEIATEAIGRNRVALASGGSMGVNNK